MKIILSIKYRFLLSIYKYIEGGENREHSISYSLSKVIIFPLLDSFTLNTCKSIVNLNSKELF